LRDSRHLDPEKFRDPDITLTGDLRARVPLETLSTLWFNTGSLCNITCKNCYIESSPRNNRLSYISSEEVKSYLNEIALLKLNTKEIGFTGGEPFMNPEIAQILEISLSQGFRTLILTNAMRPMRRYESVITKLNEIYPGKLILRVSIDHYSESLHERIRGPGSWKAAIDGLIWLSNNNFQVNVAGRTIWKEEEKHVRGRYADLFSQFKINVNAQDSSQLVLFPEMDANLDVPEITSECWQILDVNPMDMMCSSSRMVIKRRGVEKTAVIACTLLPYEDQFELGHSIAESFVDVKLNHPHCAQFCVLGGGSCSQ